MTEHAHTLTHTHRHSRRYHSGTKCKVISSIREMWSHRLWELPGESLPPKGWEIASGNCGHLKSALKGGESWRKGHFKLNKPVTVRRAEVTPWQAASIRSRPSYFWVVRLSGHLDTTNQLNTDRCLPIRNGAETPGKVLGAKVLSVFDQWNCFANL